MTLALFLLSAIAALFWLVRPLLRQTARAREGADIAVYKAQLAEIEADLARGVVGDAEAGAMRTEVARRLLAASERDDSSTSRAPQAASVTLAAMTVLLAAGGTAAIYFQIGAPGLPDRPLAEVRAELKMRRAQRPTQAEFEARMDAAGARPEPTGDPDHIALVERLRTLMETRPDEIEGHRLLAVNLARLGQFREAHAAQARLVELLGDDATAGDITDLAEFLVSATNGYVSPEAETALIEALARDGSEPRARYYSGLLAVQNGRPDIAYGLWMALLEEGPADAPWNVVIRSQIGEVARLANLPAPQVADAPRGPSAGDMAAAADMSPEARQEMIRGMVDGLSQRLASEGGTAAEWAQLLRALGVLGETERAAAIWQEASTVFAAHPAELDAIRAAAQDAGVAF